MIEVECLDVWMDGICKCLGSRMQEGEGEEVSLNEEVGLVKVEQASLLGVDFKTLRDLVRFPTFDFVLLPVRSWGSSMREQGRDGGRARDSTS